MILLYEASNSIEAHLLLNLLEQSGLSARIDGEYLQGGVGELQAMGIVRVMVDEKDYAEAKTIVQEWDARQPKPEDETKRPNKKSNIGVGLIGFIAGAAAVLVYYNTPVTRDGIDYNGDGGLDEKWTYANYRISKVEADRNFDGKIDAVHEYDHKGLIDESSLDENFDGVFETDMTYRRGLVYRQKSDTNGDGFYDYRVAYEHGSYATISFINPANEKVLKVQEFGPFVIEKARVDTSGDGVLDTVYEYDSIEEIVRKYTR